MSLSSNNHILRALFLFWGLLAMAQAQQISYQTEEKPLIDILEDISDAYGLFFSYSPELLAPYSTSIRADNQDIEDFLTDLLDPFNLQARRSKGQYFYIQKALKRLEIYIKDLDSGESLAYAIIQSLGTRRGAYANANGAASFVYDTRKDSTLLIRHIGYNDRRIRLFPDIAESLSIQMVPDSLSLNEVVIEYNNEAITLVDGAHFKVKPQRMRVLPGLAESDVLLSVQSLPGIESNDETASGINVRGSGSDELIVYWDRIPVYKQAHFFGTLTTFIPSTIEEVSTYKNYIPANYTGATSGLMEIKLPDSIPYRPTGVFNANFTHADVMAHIPFKKKVSLMVAGRFSFHDQFNSPTFIANRNKLFAGSQQEDFLDQIGENEEEDDIPILADQTDLFYGDLNAKLVITPTKRDYLSVSWMRNVDDFLFNVDGSVDEDRVLLERTHNVIFSGGNFLYKRKWKPRWESQVSVSFADYYMQNSDLEQFDEGLEQIETNIENQLRNTEVKLSLAYQTEKYGQFQVGYQYNEYENFFRYQEQSTFEAPFLDTLEAEEAAQGLFLAYQYSLADRLDFQPQVRIDRVPGLGETLVNPVISLHYQLMPNLWLKSSYGQYFQLIRSLQEGDLDVSNVSESVWLLAEGSPIGGGDDELPIIESRQLSVGALFKNKGWLIDLDVYWKGTDNLSSVNQFNKTFSTEFTFGNAEAFGVDVMIRKKFGRYLSWMSYSYMDVSSFFEDISPNPFPSSFERPHQFRWVHNLYLAPLEISLGWTLQSGTPYTEPTGLTFIPDDPFDPDIEEGDYEIAFGPVNRSRLPLYHRLDLSVWYKFEHKPGGFSGQAGFSIQNLYNRENVWLRFYFLDDFDEDMAPEIIEEERFFLGFTPNLSVRLNF